MMFSTTFKIGGCRVALGGLILGVLILFTPFFVSAGLFPFTDTFVQYPVDSNLGDYWLYCNSTNIRIRDTECHDDHCAFSISDGGWTCWEDGDTIETDGHWVWWNYLDKIGIERGAYWRIDLEDSTGQTVIVVYYNSPSGETTIFLQGKVEGDAVLEPITTNLQADEWFKLDCEWKDLGNEDLWLRYIRCRFNEEDWSNWINPISDNQNGTLKRLKIKFNRHNDRIDNIGEKVCELGNCKYCEIYDTCIGADCTWYYSIYLQKYYCVEPFTPDPEDCGSFYKCQYCLTQTPCELELNCEWVDRGFGKKCYMIEPEIPPEQVGWEAPTLEDCGELSGVEKWLCEIKNFIAGIFMPSQEALDKLYNTIGSFKNKFPFNYVGALNSFFDDVKDSLDEEKEIPVKILGQEGNVDFSFWDKTTTIGGVGETLKNIVFDFTSLIIFFAWFVWLISFIKRFF